MTTRPFTSPLKDELERFLQYKRAAGCRYQAEESALGCLDRFLARHLAARDPVSTLDVVRAFVQEGQCSNTTREHRLTLVISSKKTVRPTLGYLSDEEMETLLAQVDRSTSKGQRDYLLLALLYDTGTRIQEALDVTPADFHLTSPAFVRVLGKGKKERLCPLLPQTARVVSRFLEAAGRHPEDRRPLFENRRGEQLTRQGARYLLRQYLCQAAKVMPRLSRARISLHTLRHTKAMHLLQSGVPIITIKDVLGHADVRSTAVYVQTDLEAKRKALEQAGTPSKETRRSRRIAPDLLEWLESL